MLLVIYVDDIIVAAKGQTWTAPLQSQLEQHFEIKYLGPASWVLGMAWQHDIRAGTLTLHQGKYVDDMLIRFNMTECSPAPTPMAKGGRPFPALKAGHSLCSPGRQPQLGSCLHPPRHLGRCQHALSCDGQPHPAALDSSQKGA